MKTAPRYANHAESIVRSVTIIFVPIAEYATTARAAKKTSVMTAFCVPDVRYYAWNAAIAKGAPFFVPIAENVVRSVTIVFALTVEYATSVQADTSVLIALCAPIVR